MQYVTWQAIDSSGTLHEGAELIGPQEDVAQVLRAQGLELVHARTPARWLLAWQATDSWRQALDQVMVLVKAGVPLVHALESTAQTATHPYVRQVLAAMARAVGNGQDVAAVCDAQQDIIGPLYGQVCRVGMQTGTLTHLLPEYIALEQERAQQARALRSQAAGPLITLLLLLVVGMVGLGVLVPLMHQLYETMGAPVPGILHMADRMRAHGAWMAAGALALLGLGYLVGRRFPAQLDALWFALPWWGPVRRQTRMSSTAQALAIFLQARLPLAQALYMTQLLAPGPVMARMLADIGKELMKGKDLPAIVAAYPDFFDPGLISVIRTGLYAGTVHAGLLQWAAAQRRYAHERLGYIQLGAWAVLYTVIGALAVALMYLMYQPLWAMPSATL